MLFMNTKFDLKKKIEEFNNERDIPHFCDSIDFHH